MDTTHTTHRLIVNALQRDICGQYAGNMQDADMVLAELTTDAYANKFMSTTEFLRIARRGLIDAGAKHSMIVKLDNIIRYIATPKD